MGIHYDTILNALVQPILVVGEGHHVRYVNQAAEQFFAAGASYLMQHTLDDVVAYDSPLLALIEQVREDRVTTSEYEVNLGVPRTGPRLVNITVSPVSDAAGDVGDVIVTLQESTIASKMDRQLVHRSAARSVSGMAAVLAHEVKNPLSGIRGAAQLLEQDATPEEQELTQLICDETDRIVAMVERMERFSDKPLDRKPVNIHEVLERVRRIATAGFAAQLRVQEDYDPSLPPVPGDFDQLVQVFLNLVKNAAEAAGTGQGEIVLKTAFRHGVRLEMPGSKDRVRLPLEVTVQDNGPGVPDDLQPYLFDPFVGTKTGGSGLGLALVAKIVGDHGGVVECNSEPRKTIFRVMLPMHEETSR